jgi:hypothetical protein
MKNSEYQETLKASNAASGVVFSPRLICDNAGFGAILCREKSQCDNRMKVIYFRRK